MHAYLFAGEGEGLENKINSLAQKLSAKTFEYPLQKIEDVRNLNNLIGLSFDTPTLVVCRDIHSAGEEALNAFLKNLEEPQENIFFALTTTSVRKVIPTIVSRCQIVKIKGEGPEGADRNLDKSTKFLIMPVGERLSYTDKIKDRDEAVDLAENTVYLLHSKLHSDRVKYSSTAEKIRAVVSGLAKLRANGNVKLQLAVLSINLG
ncbi:MAG TPA: hypothetical protein VJ227_02835 [Patescibacteria group bacterium]|nr:hypothetical protein [Patescibacteria group bacterium]